MRYGSVCSGIEAATVAWHQLGWAPAWFSEIEPFPSAVLKHHYPNVPNYGDMTKFQEWPNEPIDLLVGGTPCQSFSVAGLRKGLADPRGNLMLTFGAIAERYRPEWLVWENVPGVLSSNNGRDFGTFLGMLAELGYGFAYRVLDAQYFGVAQRRRRVFVVANARSWQRAAAVLFERESLRGNPAPSRETGQDVAGTIAARFGISRNNHEECVPTGAASGSLDVEVAGTLTRGFGKLGAPEIDAYTAIPVHCADVTSALCAADGPKGVSDQYAHEGKIIAMGSGQANAEIREDGGAPSLTCLHEAPIIAHSLRGEGFDASEDGTGRGTPLVPVAWSQEIADPLTANEGRTYTHEGSNNFRTRNVQAVAQPIAPTLPSRSKAGGGMGTDFDCDGGLVAQPVATDLYNGAIDGEATHSLRVGNGNAMGGIPSVMSAMQVRRLTPVECERLQGFPDNYTNIPWRKSLESPDGPRYKALGNSMAVPVMRWIGKRIAEVNAL